MKVYNIFTFFDEIELLKFRIDYLKDVVDYFVIVEADETFSGLPKKQNFSYDFFDADVRDRIRYSFISYPDNIDYPVKITDTGNPLNKQAWAREWYSRSRLSDGLYDAQADDMVLLSDVDEVTYQELLQEKNRMALSNLLDVNKVIDLTQYVFHYNLDGFLLNPDKSVHICNATKLCKFKNFTTAYEIRGISTFHIGPSGCHFSYFGGVDKIKNKIKSFSHTELANDRILDSIDECVKDNKQFYHDLILTDDYPKTILPKLIFTSKYIDYFQGNFS